LFVKNNNVNKIALAKFSVLTSVMLVGGLAVVVIPAATTTAYADATHCASFFGVIEQCETVGKNPESCSTTECTRGEDENRETGRSAGQLHRICAHSEVLLECSVEGGPPER
jgi:hypothetical protein